MADSGRPAGLVVVTGTSTGVGKTWFSAVTLGLLRHRGVRVAARKPVQSHAPDSGPTDAEVLAAATGEEPATVCRVHRNYPLALAPPMAAETLGKAAFTVADLADELAWPLGTEIGFVEGVGGPRSPLAADGDTVDLVDILHPNVVVIVADAGLGAINAVQLSRAPFAEVPCIVALNRFDPGVDALHERNRAWLELRGGLVVVTSPTALADRLVP
jgi:dethiobiotin synthetase